MTAARAHPLGHFVLSHSFLSHRVLELPREHTLDRNRACFLVQPFVLHKIVEGRTDAPLLLSFAHVVSSFFRFNAKSRSAFGVLCVFLMKPCRSTICFSVTQKITRVMRRWPMSLRISNKPSPSERHTGIPTGQPNSAVAISWPTVRRSASSKP